uniref:Uncharacterized protein n=1 Tax=Anguilla anguilla TaxID=7936 RepID=A0A0E9VQ29_ANGAN
MWCSRYFSRDMAIRLFSSRTSLAAFASFYCLI